jgi:hypothetical protein
LKFIGYFHFADQSKSQEISQMVKVLLLFLLLFFSVFLKAQVSLQKDSSTKRNELLSFNPSTQVDLIDIARNILNKGTPRREDTIIDKKGKVHFGAFPAAGYTLETGFAGVVSANAAFFTNIHNHEQENTSTILTSLAYTSHNQIIFPLQSNIWIKSNKYNVLTDWRYLKYPSETYGLGGHTNIDSGYSLTYSYLRLHQTFLFRIGNELYAGLGYDLDHFWNIREIDPAPIQTDYRLYGFHSMEAASGISLNVLFDSRRNPINPQKGLFANIVFKPKFVFLGSTSNWQSLLVEFRSYQKIPEGSRNILALWSYNWFTVGGIPPYLLLPSTGWDEFSNTGRGYIQGRFRGRNMLDQEAEYRFVITPNGLFGGVVFVNAQSFTDKGSNRFEVISPGVGLGIRVKLNKFSRTNLALDYGWGTQGSQGFFVNLGEVF